MPWTLEIWVEGTTDARVEEQTHEVTGILGRVVLRTLRELSGLSHETFEARLPAARVRVSHLGTKIKGPYYFRGGRRRGLDHFSTKLLLALDRARRTDTLIIAAWDRDNGPDREDRVSRRDAVVAYLREHGLRGQLPVVCIQEVEAWLLADFDALAGFIAGEQRREWFRDPEALTDPKGKLQTLIGKKHAGELGEIADRVNLGVLADRCPEGYGTFRAHATELIVPLLKGP